MKVIIQFESDADREMIGASPGSGPMVAHVSAVIVRQEIVPMVIFGAPAGRGVYKKYLELEIDSLREEGSETENRLLGRAYDSNTEEAMAREDGEAEQPLDSLQKTGDGSFQDRE